MLSILSQANLPLGFLVLAIAAVSSLTFVLYRLFFHPLAKYPGPFLAKVTSLYTAYHALIGDRHLNAYKLHQKYGNVVRVGPNIVSFDSKEALKDIYNINANVQKGFLYHVVTSQFGFASTFSTTDKAIHAQKKRVLAPAFTDASLKNIEEFFLKHIRTFISQIGPKETEQVSTVDMGHWSNYLTFDVMGDVSFGKEFGMLEKPDLRDLPRLGNAAGHRALIAGSSRLIFNLGLDRFFAANIAKDGMRFKTHVQKTLTERLKSDIDRQDFFSYLLKAKESGKGQPYEFPELVAEARSLMVAGSDTTATQLAANFFYITQNPSTWSTLCTEIRSKFTDIEEIRLGPELDSCLYLKAVVEESLRINPSVPGYLPRRVLPGGITIAGEFFPAGVEVGVTTYALHHNEAYWPDSHVHRPERWLVSDEKGGRTAEEVQANYAAFAPFSLGSRMCIGRKMAYFELWIAIARAVFEYDVAYVSGGKETVFGSGVCEYKLEDAFASKRDGPVVEFRRKKE